MMIPFRDNIPSRRSPILTVSLAIMLVAGYIVVLALNENNRIVSELGFAPHECSSLVKSQEGSWSRSLITLFTSQFIHVGFLALMFNVWFLWLFGENLEERLGRFRFLCLVLSSGAVGLLCHTIVNPDSPALVSGAGGAVSGVIFAYLATFPYARMLTLVPFFKYFWPIVELPAFLFLAFWILIQWLLGPMIDVLAYPLEGTVMVHVGGALTGVAMRFLLMPTIPERHGPNFEEVTAELEKEE